MESDDAVETRARAGARVGELRASLTARLDAETLLAEAGAARQAAVRDADAILAEAQQVAADLVAHAQGEAERRETAGRAEADALLGRARADAEAVRGRAEAEVEAHRRRVRGELTTQITREVAERARVDLVAVREQSEAMIGDLAASVRILGVALETAQTNVAEMLTALDDLRVHAVDGMGVPSADATVLPVAAHPAPGDRPDEGGAADGPGPAGDDAPASAMEAYLSLAHIDFGDPALPPLDDAEVGARYARDAERGLTVAPEPADEPMPGEPATDADPSVAADLSDVGDGSMDGAEASRRPRETDKPLGWLFRSAP